MSDNNNNQFVIEIDGTKKYEAEKLAGYLISNFK